jgi:hypothetical protein
LEGMECTEAVIPLNQHGPVGQPCRINDKAGVAPAFDVLSQAT